MDTEKQLTQLVEKTQKAFGSQLVSLILYGSAAGGEYDNKYSDLNVLCVLSKIGVAELAAAEPIFHWWCQLGNPAPVLMSAAEVAGSSDCFPIEYQDMQQCRIVLCGSDAVADLTIDRSFYRAQVEYELRSKLLRLRQKAAGVLHDSELLVRLMADSVSTFLVLGRHGLRLAGHKAPAARRDIAAALGTHFGADTRPLETLLDVREKKVKAGAVAGAELFGQYLESVQTLVNAVDALHKSTSMQGE